jgi:hypothetical protein
MKITKRQLKRIIKEEYSRLIKEEFDAMGNSADPNDYIENMQMGLGFSDAEEMQFRPNILRQAVADIRGQNYNYEDLVMAPDSAIQSLIDQSDAIYDLAMEATEGEGYDQYPLSDEWRGFLIAFLAAG